MKYQEKFKNVLKDDEKIVAIETCNKKVKILRSCLALFCFSTILLIVFTILQVSLGPLRIVDATRWGENVYAGFPILVTIFVPLFFYILSCLIMILNIKAAKNYFLCLTDKRIIERSGIFTCNYSSKNIENVSGNISLTCYQTIFARNDNTCLIMGTIELAPVGHGSLHLYTKYIENGYEFEKKLEDQIKINAKTKLKTIKE